RHQVGKDADTPCGCHPRPHPKSTTDGGTARKNSLQKRKKTRPRHPNNNLVQTKRNTGEYRPNPAAKPSTVRPGMPGSSGQISTMTGSANSPAYKKPTAIECRELSLSTEIWLEITI